MSQSELANQLQITQSFLSAIENGKSPLPTEKVVKLCDIFGLSGLDDYLLDRKGESDEKRIAEMTDSDLFNQLLSRFHRQAHSSEEESHHHDHHQRIEELQKRVEALYARNDALMTRNDSLSADNDRLRSEIDGYRREIDRLRNEIFELRKIEAGKV